MRYSLISRISLAAPRQNKMAGCGAVSALAERCGGRSPKLPRVAVRPEKREPIEQVLATVDVLAEGEREQGERGNFSNLVSQLSAFEVLRLT